MMVELAQYWLFTLVFVMLLKDLGISRLYVGENPSCSSVVSYTENAQAPPVRGIGSVGVLFVLIQTQGR